MNLLANLRHLRLSHVLFTVLVAAILLYLIIPVVTFALLASAGSHASSCAPEVSLNKVAARPCA